MVVIATAGHVDHGKSTLVRALTGMEPDRWAEEHRRGLTIDLGYAWATTDSGSVLSFVDVPGHQRFIGNMLAGVGPVPAVMLVVAADAGWSAQTSEHLAAIQALQIRHGIVVVTRADRGDPQPVLAKLPARLRGTSLEDVPTVAVSAVTGSGMAELRQQLDALVAETTAGAEAGAGRTRLWIDRSFTVRGAGTVVTGTLGEGSIRRGDELDLLTPNGSRRVGVRSLQSLGADVAVVHPVRRVALNLRGVAADEVSRGASLVTPDDWWAASEVDVRVAQSRDLPTTLAVHLGTASQEVHVRPLGEDVVRLRLQHPLPLAAGDRGILRNPGTREIVGLTVLDVDPPSLRRRGAARQRAAELAAATGDFDLVAEVGRRGAVPVGVLQRLGAVVPHPVAPPLRAWPAGQTPQWIIHTDRWRAWTTAAHHQATRWQQDNPLAPRMPLSALAQSLELPADGLAADVARAAGLEVGAGRAWLPGAVADLGYAEAGLAELESRLRARPFQAPTAEDLAALGLTASHLRSAVGDGRLLRLADDALLAPTAPALAMRELSRLEQPFTLSQARQALDTTRRVAVPLLELLDQRGWTTRISNTHRQITRPAPR